MVKKFSATQGILIIAFQAVHNSDFPQPPTVTPRNETLSQSGCVNVMAMVSHTLDLMAAITTTGVQ